MFAKLLSTFDYLDGSACGLDFFAGSSREAMRTNSQRDVNFTIPKNFDACVVKVRRSEAALSESLDIHNRTSGKRLKVTHVNDVVFLAE